MSETARIPYPFHHPLKGSIYPPPLVVIAQLAATKFPIFFMLTPSLTSAVSGAAVWSNDRSSSQFHPLALSAYCPPRARVPMALSTKEHKPERAGVKLLVGAGVCLSYELALGHYLEFIKIMKQTKPQFSYLHLTKEIMHSKGLVGIWDGFFPWGAIQGVAKGSVFAWGHSIARTSLQPMVIQNKISKDMSEVLAGGIGGGFQGFVLSPTLLLKTRVMTDPIFREQMTPLETMSKSMRIGVKVIQKEGVAALMKGSGMFSLKRVADWSTRFFFSVQAENIVYKRNNPDRLLTTSEQVIASLLGGVVSAAVTLPMDVLVAQIQQASKAGVKVSVAELFRQQYRAGGINQVLSFGSTGFIARLFHASFTTMIMKTATSIVYDMVEGRS
ncbi:hypothetical protein BBO99_00005370 [Phytophthora kernoviae]|uniref:Mitochondrial carrier protein n=1 Tax=Phytophthora kernoviae TaxID=325452 RepID=A0A3R7JCX0_9STRA|nr:hypothetical protein JM16_005127 [Phytophthora kernoviae]KAG2525935.1 hypothetical protein JM18_004622 [Phytophthora kernoviae]RLN37237.1 hypothetical protein BBI17_005314 [Phytophthora kernoviae]RLN79288.1 hypothetical protein BBO99_00005370 [Phytophthora kernoviae]